MITSYPSRLNTYVVSTAISSGTSLVAYGTVAKECYSLLFIEAVISGGTSPTGTFKLQCSLTGTTWTDVASSSQAITDNGSVVWNIATAAYPFWRLVYTRTSGSGTLNAGYFMQ